MKPVFQPTEIGVNLATPGSVWSWAGALRTCVLVDMEASVIQHVKLTTHNFARVVMSGFGFQRETPVNGITASVQMAWPVSSATVMILLVVQIVTPGIA